MAWRAWSPPSKGLGHRVRYDGRSLLLQGGLLEALEISPGDRLAVEIEDERGLLGLRRDAEGPVTVGKPLGKGGAALIGLVPALAECGMVAKEKREIPYRIRHAGYLLVLAARPGSEIPSEPPPSEPPVESPVEPPRSSLDPATKAAALQAECEAAFLAPAPEPPAPDRAERPRPTDPPPSPAPVVGGGLVAPPSLDSFRIEPETPAPKALPKEVAPIVVAPEVAEAFRESFQVVPEGPPYRESVMPLTPWVFAVPPTVALAAANKMVAGRSAGEIREQLDISAEAWREALSAITSAAASIRGALEKSSDHRLVTTHGLARRWAKRAAMPGSHPNARLGLPEPEAPTFATVAVAPRYSPEDGWPFDFTPQQGQMMVRAIAEGKDWSLVLSLGEHRAEDGRAFVAELAERFAEHVDALRGLNVDEWNHRLYGWLKEWTSAESLQEAA